MSIVLKIFFEKNKKLDFSKEIYYYIKRIRIYFISFYKILSKIFKNKKRI